MADERDEREEREEQLEGLHRRQDLPDDVENPERVRPSGVLMAVAMAAVAVLGLLLVLAITTAQA